MQGMMINVDLDGVVYDFTEAMREAFDYRFGQAMLDRGEPTPTHWPDPWTWELDESWPVERQTVMEVMQAEILDRKLFRYGHAIDGAIEGLREIQAMGHHIRIVTAKTFNDPYTTQIARASTLGWLYDNDVPHNTLAFSDSRGKESYRAAVVIDDKPKLTDWVQPQALNVLMDQPWNRTIETFPSDLRFARCRSWSDIVEMVDSMSRQEVLL